MIEAWKYSDWVEKIFMVFVAALVGFGVVAIAALVYNARGITGTVVGKDFTEEHYVNDVQCVIQPSGSCSPIVIPRYVPDTWTIVVDPDDGSANVSRSVNESYWNSVQIGDRWEDS